MHVDLGPPRERTFPHLARDGIDGVRRRAQGGNLIVVLDRADRAHHGGSGRPTGTGASVLQGEREPGPGGIADRDRPRATESLGHDGHGVATFGPGMQRRHAGLGHAGCFQTRDDQHRLTLTGQHEHREPLQRHGLVSGEIREIGADRQQQGVDVRGRHGCSHPTVAGLERSGADGHAPTMATDAPSRA